MIWKDVLAPAMDHPRVEELKKTISKMKEKKESISIQREKIFFVHSTYVLLKTLKLLSWGKIRTTLQIQQMDYAFPQEDRKRQLPYRLYSRKYLKISTYNTSTKKTTISFSLPIHYKIGPKADFSFSIPFLPWKGESPVPIKNMGWELVVDSVLEGINKKETPVIFLLWGKYAEAFKPRIDDRHLIFTAPHPAAELNNPTGPKFSGCGHFSAVRDILPSLEGMNLFKTANLDHCFDKEKAKRLLKTNYPAIADDACNYIDQEMMIHIPVNRREYWDYTRKFEKSFIN